MSLTETTLQWLRKTLTQFRRPIVYWSGGKDSMVLLHLMRQMDAHCLVLHHREALFPWKETFADQMAQAWDIVVYDYLPVQRGLQEREGRVEVAARYQVSPTKHFHVPKNIEPPSDRTPLRCGLDWLRQPTGGINYPWDVALIGHKGSDVDPFLGAIALTTKLFRQEDAPALAFPLKDWSDADIWNYIKAHDVPYDMRRYDSKDTAVDPDTLQCCIRCIDRTQPATVDCPLYQRAVPNLSSHVPYFETPQLAYLQPQEVA